MKRILIISQYFYPESFRINDLSSKLVKRGYQVTVLTGYPNYPQGRFFPGYRFWKKPLSSRVYEGVSIIRLPILPRGNTKLGLALNYLSFWILGHFFVLFTRRRFDLVFTYGISPIFQGAIANHYARKFKVKSFLYLMDFWPYSITAVNGIKNSQILKLITSIITRIYLKTDLILISSLGYQDDLVKMGIPPKKICYWPQYHESFYRLLPKNFIKTPEIKNDRKFKFCFTGNLGYAQGILEFLGYLNAYQNELRNNGLIFYFIGDGRAKADVIKLINIYRINDLAIIIGHQPSEKIPQYLANCDLALLLIKNDNYMTKVLPAKVATYVGCHKPIFCVSNGNLADFIYNNKLGYVTNSFEFKVIHLSLMKVVKNFSKTFKVKYKNIFSSEILLDELDNILKKV
jgi:hypothetical protein